MSIAITLLFLNNVIKIGHFDVFRLHITDDYDYKIYSRDDNFIVS